MLKIDLHTHILPERWPDWTQRSGYPGWVRLEHCAPGCARMVKTEASGGEALFREVGANCWEPEERLRECDSKMGLESAQVLSTVPVMFSYWAKPKDAYDLSRFLNDHIAGVCAESPRTGAHPAAGGEGLHRFIGLGTVPMQDTELAIRELERCVAPASRGGLGLPGIQIGTNVNERNLDDPGVVEFFAAAAALGAAVFVHPWDVLGRERMTRYWLPWLVGMPAETCLAICSIIFAGVFEKAPDLRICFAHGGGSFPLAAGRVQHGHRVRPDLCAVDNTLDPSRYTANGSEPARFYVDSLVHNAEALRFLLRVMSPTRVALGSDYPFPLGEDPPGCLIESMPDLDDATRARLFAGTALEFLGLPSPVGA